MLCYRCGGHVKDGAEKCASCGQHSAPALKPGPAAGVGNRRHRVAVEGAPCRAGDVVAGCFQIKDQAGQGPLGWMYRAVELGTDSSLALKILAPRFLQGAEEKRLFLAEQQKAQRLAHQNIARVYQAGEDQDRPFIALQLLEGTTLRRIMEQRRQKGQGFGLEEIEPIVAQIAAALDAAASTFAHGNLKPDNVVVLPDLLKLTDFGLAGGLPRAPFMAAQRAFGVHRYLAPEFLLGDPLDPRADVFSLGVMLGELLTGAHHEAQLSLLGGRPQLPPAVEEIYRRAVAARPADRFASAGELAAELSRLVAATPRPTPLLAEDAGDVVIEEVHTDPRLRIARALAAQDAAAAEAPREPAPFVAAPFVAPPFVAPPPYEPAGTRDQLTTPGLQAPLLREERIVALREDRLEAAAEAKLIEVAARVGATPELLTAETAVRATPTARPAPLQEIAPAGEIAPADDARDRPRRGAGKRGKDRHGRSPRPRRGGEAALASSAPPALFSAAQPAVPGAARATAIPPASVPPTPAASLSAASGARTSQPPATEGALATGPATSALVPLQPEPFAVPVRRSRPPSPRSSPPSFGAIVEEKKSPKAFMFATLAIIAVAMLGAGATFLGSRKASAEPAGTEAPAPLAAGKTAEAGTSASPALHAAALAAGAAAKAPAPAKAEQRPDPRAAAEPAAAPTKARTGDHRTLREKIGAVREAARQALDARQRKRDEALAQAAAARAAARREAAQPAAPSSGAASAAVGTALSAAAAKPLPPAGAINGVDDTDLLARRGKLVAYAAAGETACPPGMQRVQGGPAQIGSDARDDLRNFGDRTLSTVEVRSYCIDAFEFPNTPGRLPQVAAAWSDADASCRNAGKRLCSEEEWEKACKGPEASRFPYGMNFDANACNTQDAKENPRQVAVVGSFGKCRSGYGVWDMSGNAAEWTATSFDETGGKTVKGGHAARPGFDDRCASRRKLPPGQHDVKVGFRCCADAR